VRTMSTEQAKAGQENKGQYNRSSVMLNYSSPVNEPIVLVYCFHMILRKVLEILN